MVFSGYYLKVQSDHQAYDYVNVYLNFSSQAPKDWSKKIQSEWKILEKDLPGESVIIEHFYPVSMLHIEAFNLH